MVARRYSVYYRKTDTPLIIYATSKECAKAMGITLHSFYRYICRIKQGIGVRKWEVFVDDMEDEDEE